MSVDADVERGQGGGAAFIDKAQKHIMVAFSSERNGRRVSSLDEKKKNCGKSTYVENE